MKSRKVRALITFGSGLLLLCVPILTVIAIKAAQNTPKPAVAEFLPLIPSNFQQAVIVVGWALAGLIQIICGYFAFTKETTGRRKEAEDYSDAR